MMITNIALITDKILPLSRYWKDGIIKDTYLFRHFFFFFPTDDNNNEESENKESISDLLKSFKPYYSMNIERNTIIFHILLFADKISSIKPIKEVSIKEMKDYYYIYIKGYKNNAYKHFYNIHYGNFFIETEISKNELTLENKQSEISEDNNGYIIVTIN